MNIYFFIFIKTNPLTNRHAISISSYLFTHFIYLVL